MPYYYVSGVIDTLTNGQKALAIHEEDKGKQVSIAFVPYNPRHRYCWNYAMRDARMIVEALNARCAMKQSEKL